MPCSAKFLPHNQRGAVLATALMLLLIVTLISITAVRSITLGLQLTTALRSADHATALATNGAAAALRHASEQAHTLPQTGILQLHSPIDARGRVTIAIRPMGSGICAAPFTGTRSDYRADINARAGRHARSAQRLDFYICRENCASAPCAESAPQVYGWAELRPN